MRNNEQENTTEDNNTKTGNCQNCNRIQQSNTALEYNLKICKEEITVCRDYIKNLKESNVIFRNDLKEYEKKSTENQDIIENQEAIIQELKFIEQERNYEILAFQEEIGNLRAELQETGTSIRVSRSWLEPPNSSRPGPPTSSRPGPPTSSRPGPPTSRRPGPPFFRSPGSSDSEDESLSDVSAD